MPCQLALKVRRMTGVVSNAMDCIEIGGPKDGASGFSEDTNYTGVKRFAATVMSQAIKSSRFVAEQARTFPQGSRMPFSRVVDDKLLDGCAAWLWMSGEGSRDLTFEECSWATGLDPDWVREKVMLPYGDLGDINKWVQERANSLGPLWGD
jgi:hypothetical protein